MPIISLDGSEAIRIRKANEYATWGSRNADNRVEPIAAPGFKVPCRLETGEAIFTIGSCFARNVESELLKRGFRIPIRELFQKPEFENLPTEIVNNFGTPSIYNEIAWAFGEKEYDEQTNIVEVGQGKYIDLHMVNSIRPAPLQTVVDRRHGLLDATRTLAECRMLIMTLGLVELWWDEESKNYLNTAPLPSLIKRWPKRFSLHVLSFAECYDYLRKALDIVFRNGRDDLEIVLTVSPVPMMATHRNVDVITANTYSKSLLRAVTEQLVAEESRITYFPSYETISLSDRRISWMDDFVHVNKKMVALNVERMIDAFTDQTNIDAAIIPGLGIETGESADALFLAEEARTARLTGNAAFFEDHLKTSRSSPSFALEYAKFLLDGQRYDDVLKVTSDDGAPEMVIIRARALIATKQAEAARESIRPLCLKTVKGAESWRVYVDAAVAMKCKDALLQAEAEWLEIQPRSLGLVQACVGRGLRAMGDDEAAVKRLTKAANLPNGNATVAIECAFSLITLKRFQEAAEVLNGVTSNTFWQSRQLTRLKNRIAKGLNSQEITT